MPIDISGQIVTYIFPIGFLPIYNITITRCPILRLCIYRARCDEYHAPQFYKPFHLCSFHLFDIVLLHQSGFASFVSRILKYQHFSRKKMRPPQQHTPILSNILLSLLNPYKKTAIPAVYFIDSSN